MFGFAFDSDDEPKIIAYMNDVESLESRKNRLVYRKIRLLDVENIDFLVLKIKDAIRKNDNHGYIYTLDSSKNRMHGTYISNFRIIRYYQNNLVLKGYIWNETFGYHKVLKMMQNNEITTKGQWKKLKKSELQGWLGFSFQTQNPEIDRENVLLTIDGNMFKTLDEFFCYLGEEINGPGGYFGRNLHALEDCFYGGFGIKSISNIRWIDHHKSRMLLKENFEIIVKIFSDRKKLNLILE